MSAIPQLQTTPILDLAGLNVNNSVLATLAVSVFLILLFMVFKRSLKIIPGKLQVAIESFLGFFMTQLETAWGSEERAKKYLPLILTLFLFLLIANQFSVIPLVSSVVSDGVQVLRTPSSDLGLAVTLALIVIGASHVIAFTHHPIRHIGNYIKPHELLKVRSVSGFFNALLEIFLGLLDIVGEIAKVVSLACRLFGNVFAGEVMVAVMTGLVAYIVPMPFIAISIFSGLVQAFVFALLSVQYMPGIILASEPETA
jgi:F-type H+-transporting ATPase subunit a